VSRIRPQWTVYGPGTGIASRHRALSTVWPARAYSSAVRGARSLTPVVHSGQSARWAGSAVSSIPSTAGEGKPMTVSIGAIVLNVKDVGRAADFWTRALGYVAQQDNPAFLGSNDGSGPRLHLDEDDGTHLDLWVDRSASDQQAEVERLIALGARRVPWTYPEDADFVVLADPDGNLFCVIA